MPPLARDPSDIVQRIPELAPLAERDERLRRAIERGRPHAVYRRLFFMRWLGKAGPDRELIIALLAKRRLFLEPLQGAPPLFTLNGVGLTIYGNDDHDVHDGTHIKTLYGVFVFVPVFPFSSYLVQQSPINPKAWRFIGKVPPAGLQWAWSRALAVAALLFVGGAAVRAVGAARFHDVHLVNSLPVAVEVSVGSLPSVGVPPQSRMTVNAPVGRQPIVVKNGPRTIETGELDVARGAGAIIWNVLGAGLVFRETVHYSQHGAGSQNQDEPTVWCGQSAIAVDRVDDLFSPPPREISTSSRSPASARLHVDVLFQEVPVCAGHLIRVGRAEEARRLAMAVAEASDYSEATTELAVALLSGNGGHEAVSAFIDKALSAHEDALELHRFKQEDLVREGRRHEALALYQQRAAHHPDSADDAYLALRLLPSDQSLGAAKAALLRFPRHPYLLRLVLHAGLHAGHWREAVSAGESLRDVDQRSWPPSLPLYVQALAGDGKWDEARGVVDDALMSEKEHDRRQGLVALALQLAALSPGRKDQLPSAIASLLDKAGGESPEERKLLQLNAKLAAGLPVPESELAELAEGTDKEDAKVALMARSAPTRALSALGDLASAHPRAVQLPLSTWALLLGEAARDAASDPALTALLNLSPLRDVNPTLLTTYLRTGKSEEELDELPLDVLAALHFTRSRSLKGRERSALEQRARREDLLHGPVTLAMDAWPR